MWIRRKPRLWTRIAAMERRTRATLSSGGGSTPAPTGGGNGTSPTETSLLRKLSSGHSGTNSTGSVTALVSRGQLAAYTEAQRNGNEQLPPAMGPFALSLDGLESATQRSDDSDSPTQNSGRD